MVTQILIENETGVRTVPGEDFGRHVTVHSPDEGGWVVSYRGYRIPVGFTSADLARAYAEALVEHLYDDWEVFRDAVEALEMEAGEVLLAFVPNVDESGDWPLLVDRLDLAVAKTDASLGKSPRWG